MFQQDAGEEEKVSLAASGGFRGHKLMIQMCQATILNNLPVDYECGCHEYIAIFIPEKGGDGVCRQIITFGLVLNR